ncbi:uncharacterized protein [Primulina huaijiensis]|uniref:uncharacterized protein n=1 Tax=Primulina huaijiensis TaxID=1492673 RepID=UPI003CC75497
MCIASAPDVLPNVPDCKYCGAKRIYAEPRAFCCSSGEINLLSSEMPSDLIQLYIGNDDDAKEFNTCVRSYNNMFAFTSMGVHCDEIFARRNAGIYTFRVQGQLYHFMCQLIPPENENPKNLQLYFFDTEHELSNRMYISSKFKETLTEKSICILAKNPYGKFFRSLNSIENLNDYKIALLADPATDQRVFNRPTVSQVAGIWLESNEENQYIGQHIQVYPKNKCTQIIKHYFGCYDPLQYPLIFPNGESGWHRNIKRLDKKQMKMHPRPTCDGEIINCIGNAANTEFFLDLEAQASGKNLSQRSTVSCHEYYCYKLQVRDNDRSFLLHIGRLLQQYIVDMYIKIETSRLEFFRTSDMQNRLRNETYNGLLDSITQGCEIGSDIGKRVILPTSFIGGPRDMRKRYMDAIALVQRYGKPDIFLTITSNPNWPEIKALCPPSDEIQNRLDLISRIFHAKIQVLRDELFKKNIFSHVIAYTSVIEFQKRGLPHAYFLLILNQVSKMFHPEAIDRIVCAELPDSHSNPWISPPESAWRIIRFDLNYVLPSVICLPIHLENEQVVTFAANQSLYSIANNPTLKKTMLTQFFHMNKYNTYAQNLNCLYVEFPEYFTWHNDSKEWESRKKKEVIGRIFSCRPSDHEKFYLKLLLMHVRKPTSFKDLRTINDVTFTTFREAAQMLGLIESDNTAELCIEEAAAYLMPNALRQLFATVLVFCSPKNPLQLWLKYQDFLSEDFSQNKSLTPTIISRQVLDIVNNYLYSMGKKLDDFFHVNKDVSQSFDDTLEKEVQTERNIIIPAEDLSAVEQLNLEQKNAYNRILHHIYNGLPTAFFIDGPEGTGKTFLYKAILATVRSAGHIAIATATSGVAASLLPGGRTSHSRFKIPLEENDTKSCSISKQSALAHLIKLAKLIIWDEATMARRSTIEKFNEMLQDIMDSKLLFGGKLVVLGGYFRQTLSVILKSTKNDIIDSSIVMSPLWGNGIEATNKDNEIQIPSHINIPFTDDITSLNTLIDMAIRREMYNFSKSEARFPKLNGTMQGIIYDQDVEQLDRLLQLYKTYYIGNAKIKEITSNAPVFASAKYQMFLSRSTYIRLANEEEQLPTYHAYELTTFAQCPELADVSSKQIS